MKRRDVLIVVVVMIIWGGNFSMIKIGVSEVDPLLITAVRFTLATIPVIFFIPRPKVKWRYIISYGLVFGVGVWGMASWSITAGLSSGMSSVLLQTNVLFSMAVGVGLLKETFPLRKLLGAVIALIALVISVSFTKGNVTGLGLLLIFISALSWTLLAMIVKASKTKKAFAFNVWGMLFAPVPLVLLSLFLHGERLLPDAFQHWGWETSIAVVFQAYPTTLFGYWIWNKMLIKYPLSTVAPLTLLVPVFALFSGYMIFDERLSYPQVVACGLFLVGIGLIVKDPDKAPFIMSS